MSLDPNNKDGTKLIQFGKFTGVLYPDIYFQFVSELHNNHPDLVRAMTLAKVKLQDGSARDFLNLTFGTQVTANIPMEEGFTIFYYKLRQRAATNASEKLMMKVVDENFNKNTEGLFNFRKEEFQSKPLFPSIEELKDKGIK